MRQDTLHAIMFSVLKEKGEPMYPRDLAEVIRKEGSYTQRDGTPLKDGQVSTRAGRYPDLFTRVDKRVTRRVGDYPDLFMKDSKKVTSNDSVIPETKKTSLKFKDIKAFNLDPAEDWFDESVLCATLEDYFKGNGYKIEKSNAQNKSAKGTDLIVSKDGASEFIEVKGYPSIYYVEKKKRGSVKKTTPYLQSTHWFSGCLSSTLKNYESKETKLAMAFPACYRYEELVMKNQKYFTDNNLDIKVYFIDEKGCVTISNLNKNLAL